MKQDVNPLERPSVAVPNQHMPNSAHVSGYHGYLFPDSPNAFPILALDLEGEDGQTPKNMESSILRRFDQLGLAGDFVGAIMKATAAKRQEVVKQIVPALAYLLSDVIVYVHGGAMHNTGTTKRIQEFAQLSHQSSKSIAYMPSLIILQNKWPCTSKDSQLDLTEIPELNFIREDLSKLYCRISMIRLPYYQGNIAALYYEGLSLLHRTIKSHSEFVRSIRIAANCLYTEMKWWFLLRKFVQHIHRRGVKSDDVTVDSLQLITALQVEDGTQFNAILALQIMENATNATMPQHSYEDLRYFYHHVTVVLRWYAYLLALKSKQEKTQAVDLKDLFESILDKCYKMEPCRTNPVLVNGKKYYCTQKNQGHSSFHKNPTPIARSTLGNFVYCLSLGTLWTTENIPCLWSGNFDGSRDRPKEHQYEYFYSEYLQFYGMSALQISKQFITIVDNSTIKEIFNYNATSVDCHWEVCGHCMSDTTDHQDNFSTLPCGHNLCGECVINFKFIYQANDIFCPFCTEKSTVMNRPPDTYVGYRVLSLDGGGVRGLVQVRILEAIEKRFYPFKISHLFDVIVGTSAGGIIAMGLLDGIPLEKLNNFLSSEAPSVLDVDEILGFFKMCTGFSVCDNDAMDGALVRLFGKHNINATDKPPFVFVTAFNQSSKSTVLIGNAKLEKESSKMMRMQAWRAARATSAAPVYFRGVEMSNKEKFLLVDGGVRYNCPVELGAEIARELIHQSENFDCDVDVIVSLGTGLCDYLAEVRNRSLIEWGNDLATSSHELWMAFDQRKDYEKVDKVRLNPKGLGEIPAFKSSSIKQINEQMELFFNVHNDQMINLYNYIYAKMWKAKEVNATTHSIGQFNQGIEIVLTSQRIDYRKFTSLELEKIISARDPNFVYERGCSLVEKAEQVVAAQPIVGSLGGTFGYQVDNGDKKYVTDKKFTISIGDSSTEETLTIYLNVFWTNAAKDKTISICGFPRRFTLTATHTPTK